MNFFEQMDQVELTFGRSYQDATVMGWRVAPHKINRVIHNKPATIVFWEDGKKTVVKAQNEDYDAEKGIAMAFMKRAYGNKGKYFNDIKKWSS